MPATARGSAPASSTVSAAFARGDGFIPVVEEQRGPADRPSPYRQASLAVRAVAPLSAAVELQAEPSAFTDARERGTAFSDIRTEGADASLRLVGQGRLPFAALAYVQVRDFANSFAAVGAGRAAATRTLEQYSVPSTGLGARVEVRPAFGAVELRLGADWRETEGRTQRAVPVRRRRRHARRGSPAAAPTRSAPSPKRAGAGRPRP